VLGDQLGRLAHQDARLERGAAALKQLLRRSERLLALLDVIAIQLHLADGRAQAADLRHRAMHSQQLDTRLLAEPVGVVDHALHGIERMRRAVYGKQDLHARGF